MNHSHADASRAVISTSPRRNHFFVFFPTSSTFDYLRSSCGFDFYSQLPVFYRLSTFSHFNPSPSHRPILPHLTSTSLIQPLGLHRTSHLAPSKGKKRKRKTPSNPDEDLDIKDAPPPPPPIGEYLLVGLNTVTRHLEALAATNAPSTLPTSQALDASTAPKEPLPTPSNPKDAVKTSSKTEDQPTKSAPLEASASISAPTAPTTSTANPPKVTVLILPTPNPTTSLAHAHLPTLLYLSSPPCTKPPTSTTPASSNSPSKSTPSTAPRLILLPPSSETRLAAALDIPRVGALAVLENAPGADTLVGYCRDNVGTVECAWISEGLNPQWSGIKGGY